MRILPRKKKRSIINGPLMELIPDKSWKIAVTSRSFSKNPILRSERLEKYPNTTFNDAGVSLRGEDLTSFLSGHDAAIIALEPIDNDTLSQLPALKIISKYGVGVDKIDFSALRKHRIRFGWQGGVNRRSVAELALAFMITSLRHVSAANLEVRNGIWQQHIGGLLTGNTIGIIGLCNVGKDLVRLLQPFDCQIYANDLLSFPDFCNTYQVTQTTIDEIFALSNIISLHVPLTDKTRGLISTEKLESMRSRSILINTARGGLVNEQALKKQLESGHLSAAAFDVFAQEPPRDQELLMLPNFLATPHLGGSTSEAILSMGRSAIAQIAQARTPTEENFC